MLRATALKKLKTVDPHDVQHHQIVALARNLFRAVLVAPGRVQLDAVQDVLDGLEDVLFVVHRQNPLALKNRFRSAHLGSSTVW